MPFTTYGANKCLDHILKGAAFTQPANIYIGLLTTLAGQVEASGGTYARVQKNSWPAASGGDVSNDTQIDFPTMTVGLGTIVGIGVYDAASGGNCIMYGALTTSKDVPAGSTPKFPIGDIDFDFPVT